jgi:hypothetical protein
MTESKKSKGQFVGSSDIEDLPKVNPDYEVADCGGNEELEESFKRAERRFDASREARGY